MCFVPDGHGDVYPVAVVNVAPDGIFLDKGRSGFRGGRTVTEIPFIVPCRLISGIIADGYRSDIRGDVIILNYRVRHEFTGGSGIDGYLPYGVIGTAVNGNGLKAYGEGFIGSGFIHKPVVRILVIAEYLVVHIPVILVLVGGSSVKGYFQRITAVPGGGGKINLHIGIDLHRLDGSVSAHVFRGDNQLDLIFNNG